MAFTQDMLTELEEAYAAGILNVRHGDKSVTYASLSDLWQAVLRVRAALSPRSQRPISGILGYRRY